MPLDALGLLGWVDETDKFARPDWEVSCPVDFFFSVHRARESIAAVCCVRV